MDCAVLGPLVHQYLVFEVVSPRPQKSRNGGSREIMNLLVRLIGFTATLIHGDTLVLDRWNWLKAYLPPVTTGSQDLLDVGCGTGAFTIGAARRGYRSLGLSWDKRNQTVAAQRAVMCKATLARFDVKDVRNLDRCTNLFERFDVVVCAETIEHILNDQKLMIDIAHCLKGNGQLLLTTPNYHFIPMTKLDGILSLVEDGGHVRRGYTPEMLEKLCERAGLQVRKIGYCSGYFSQKLTGLLRVASRLHHLLGWAIVLPLRVLPPILDPVFSRMFRYPGFSITLIASKPAGAERAWTQCATAGSCVDHQ